MKKRFEVLLFAVLSLTLFACGKKKEEKPSVEMPPPTEMPAPQVSVSPEIEELYINFMVEQAKLNKEYAEKTSPTDRAEYERKIQVIREKYRLDQYGDFHQYYNQLPPEKQMAFMQKVGQAMAQTGLRPSEK